MTSTLPILGFSAYSGTGKTTLLRQIIPALKQRGLRVSVVKHAHHDFDLDFPGKDSYELRKSGADQTVICTMTRMAMITEFNHPGEEPDLQRIVDSLDTGRADIVLVEGYKDIRFPKIELHREALRKPYLYPNDDTVIAIACDAQPPAGVSIPVLDINDIESIAHFIYDDFYRAQKTA
jgi:molybdopterin-guanine dinucleotide biosynthesis protein MobB